MRLLLYCESVARVQEFYCDGLDEAQARYAREQHAAKEEEMRKEKEQEEAEGSFGYVPWGSGSTAFHCTAEPGSSGKKQAIVRFCKWSRLHSSS